MISENVLARAKEFFPDLEIKYKDESTLMKIISKILFFNKSFMTNFTTTLGSTVYFPSRRFEQLRPISSLVILLHELVHVHDSKKWSKFLFSFLYMSPLTLAVLLLPFLLLSWKIFLPLILLSLCPIPSYFRTLFEKRAYLVSLYCTQQFSIKKQFTTNLDNAASSYLSSFKDSSYYFMWPFKNLDKEFADAVVKVKAGQKPYEDPVFEMIDKVLEVC
jgi:hypothetical protein